MTSVDPFKHRLRLTKWDWLRTYFLTVILVPIRIVFAQIILILMNLISRIALFNVDKSTLTKKPLTSRWMKLMKKFVLCLARIGIRFCGFYITVKGDVASFQDAPIIVGAPHSTFLDALATFYCFDWASTILAEEYKNLPIAGKIVELFQPILVRRTDPHSRDNVRKEIVRRATSNEEWPQLFISPEGMCSNRKALLPFKLGAFHPGTPIQPFLTEYPNRIDTVTWTWNQPHGAMTVIWLTLAQPMTRISIEFLPVYYPSLQEKQDPKLYATNLRTLMSQHYNVEIYDISLEEVKQKYGNNSKATQKED